MGRRQKCWAEDGLGRMCHCRRCERRRDQRDQEEARERDAEQFGNGEVRGDNSWTSPVYASTEEGRDVTVSFGQRGREGHTGIADGHLEMDDYYEPRSGHDHYGPNGEHFGDRGAYGG